MEETVLTALAPVTVADLAETLSELGTDRFPAIASWLPGGDIWLYSVPVIILLLLWLLYPVALILIICVILWLWWMLI